MEDAIKRRVVATEVGDAPPGEASMAPVSIEAPRSVRLAVGLLAILLALEIAHELPELLGTGTIRLASYPPEMSLAEKVATMMSRRELNTRDRDFADTWVLSRVHSFRASELHSAIVDVAAHRNHEVVTLAAARLARKVWPESPRDPFAEARLRV